VLRLDAAMRLSDARAVAARLAQHPDVEYAEPDLPVRAYQTVPPDLSYTSRMWHYFPPTSNFTANNKTVPAVGGANLPDAWSVLRGSRKIVVALIDSGVVTNHPEVASALLPGYDFIRSTTGLGLPDNFIANDGDGRDPDPNDAGDWITAQEKTTYPICNDGAPGDSNSSWHGTHMAGTIVGVWGNGVNNNSPAGTSTAGIAPNVRLLPVRALGKCGGVLSDIADAIEWAAGVNDPALPAPTPTPAQVINLSLGSTAGACSTTYLTATQAAIAAGALLVAAAGNESDPVNVSQPANCPNVLAVTAHTINGDSATYANAGAEVKISSPGGGPPEVLPTIITNQDNGFYTWSSLLFGPTTQASADSQGRSGPAVAGFTGTSSATAHVSAVAALVKSLQRNATPAQVMDYLTLNTRPFPAAGYCAMNPNTCGAGLLDAGAAVVAAMVGAPPLADAGPDRSVNSGVQVTLDGRGSLAFNGRTISSYAWTQTGGPAVTLAGAGTAQPTFTSPAGGQTVRFQLTVTDNAAASDSISVSVTSTAPPPAGGGGGGGAVPLAQLLLLGLFAMLARRRRGV
jgi:serine protease